MLSWYYSTVIKLFSYKKKLCYKNISLRFIFNNCKLVKREDKTSINLFKVNNNRVTMKLQSGTGEARFPFVRYNPKLAVL